MINEGQMRAVVADRVGHEKTWFILSVVLSVILWVASWGATWIFIGCIGFTFLRFDVSTTHIHLLTLLVMLILLVEGMCLGRRTIGFDQFSKSVSHDAGVSVDLAIIVAGTGFGLGGGFATPGQVAYMISSFLFCAPHATLAAFKHRRHLRQLNQVDTVCATKVFNDLFARDDWTPVADFRSGVRSLMDLVLMELIWVKEIDHQQQVKLAADVRARFAPMNVGAAGEFS